MEWAQVADDFIKIGLSGIFAALVALLIAKFSRSHEMEKERRRRRQDTFEKSVGEFQAAHQTVTDVIDTIRIAVAEKIALPSPESTKLKLTATRANLGF